MMKSFALHLIVFFIIGSNYHSSINFYSSSIADAIAPPVISVRKDAIGQVLIDETRTAHDYNNHHHRHRRLNNYNITAISNNNNDDDDGNNGRNINNADSKFYEVERYNQQQRNSRNRQSQQTTKTPRMIQRLIGGHIKYPIQPNTEDDLILSTTTPPTPNRGNFRRKLNRTSSSPSYRTLNRRKSTTVLKKLITTTAIPKIEKNNFNNDDEVFLDDEPDNWDNGILRLSAGAGQEVDKFKSKKKYDPTKTLAEQVKDGKYGLIENEIFQKPPKRPGVISYLQNDEFPHDNDKSYGGLNDDDIWLAEDHLLVIKGGGLNDKDDLNEWPPIDDYESAGRQIKIPSNPKIPPPFPVQLEENGPLQFIGNNKFTFIDPIVNESLSIYTTGNENYSPSETDNNNEKNILAGERTFENTTNNIGYYYPQTNPISWPAATLDDNNTFLNGNGKLGGSLENSTDYFDADDQSLYYPPPYSFVYKSNYSNRVPPGPLVPGIVLPPPPDSFSRLEVDSDKKQQTGKEIPFRQILTKIADYKTTPASRHQSAPAPRTTIPPTQLEQKKEIVYAVTQPVKTQKNIEYYTDPQQTNIISAYPTPSPVPEIISFVPKSSTGKDTLSKENPIYYEYFEAKKTPASNQVYYSEQFTTSAPAPPKPTTPTISSTRPIRPSKRRQRVKTTTNQTPVQQQQNRVNKPYPTVQPQLVNYEDIVYITPKPEIRPNNIPLNNNNNFVPLVTKPTYKRKPIENFEHDVDAIRQTLEYFNVEQLQNNNIPRTAKGKQAVYQFTYDTTNAPSAQPPQFDTEPFKPMVKYSVPAGDVNGFKAIPYVKIDKTKDIRNQKYYNPPSSAQMPDDKVRVQILYNPTQQFQDFYSSSAVASESSTGQRSGHGKDSNRISIITPNTARTTQKPWISIEKQVLEEVNNNGGNGPISTRPTKKQRNSSVRKIEPNSNRFTGYFYGPPPQSSAMPVGSIQPRQNSRYYDEPFTNHIAAIQNKLSEYQQPRTQQQWNLENDTYVNYVNPRPPINPNSEFISRNYNEREQYRVETPPPPPPLQPVARQKIWSLENDTYINFIPENRPPINPNAEYISQPHRQNIQSQSLPYRQPYRQQHQQYQQQQQQQQRPWSLMNDTYVNYAKPRPPLNPNAEFIANREQSHYYPQYYHQRRPQNNNFNGQIQHQPQRIPQNNNNNNNNGAVYPGHSLLGDTDVNYRPPYSQINPNSEFINPQQSQYHQQHYYQQQQQDNQSGGNNNNNNNNYYQNRPRSP